MHRTKKMTVTSAVVALLMAAGASSAMAARSDDTGNDDHKVTICHATHSAKNPFVRIHVSKNSDKVHGHAGHEGDTIVDDDANVAECRTAPPPGDNHGVTICHFISAGHYERIHTTEDNDEALTLHGGHENDEIVRDDRNFWQCPKADDGEGDDDEGNGNCSATSTSGDQVGLVNVNAANLGSNVLCGSSLLNHTTASVLGTAIGGSGDTGSADKGCTAESHSGNQVGLANVQAGNLASNVLCHSEILNYLTASVLGSSFGGSPLGSGALGGGSGGLLSGLLTADASVLANIGLIF